VTLAKRGRQEEGRHSQPQAPGFQPHSRYEGGRRAPPSRLSGNRYDPRRAGRARGRALDLYDLASCFL